MARIGRPGLTKHELAELWRRYRLAETMRDIGRALGRSETAVYDAVCRRGGFAPPERARRPSFLTASAREEISRGIAMKLSLRTIAANIGKSASTVSREIRRNGGMDRYRALDAEDAAWERARRPKKGHLAQNWRLRRVITAKLESDWSPQQIAGWLKTRYPDDPTMHVSHETIYRSLFVQSRGELKKALTEHLRTRRTHRRPRHSTLKGQSRGQIVEAISIAERPAEADDRAVPGHWEGDLLAGGRHSHIATLVERHSRFVILVKLPGRDTLNVVSALSKAVKRLPSALRKSLTWDLGAELAAHKQFTIATDVQVYFCDPHSPWQRGSNENTNGLLRQYFPKGKNLSDYSQADLDRVALKLNQRPRKTLAYRTPADILDELLR